MSKVTISQMEAVLLDRIEKAKIRLEKLQQKHKLEIGNLAYKHNFHRFDLDQLDKLFSKFSQELQHDNS
jgi:putative heme iron utilization protein